MAVENKFANSSLGTGTLLDSSKGGNTKLLSQSVAIAVADDDGSKYGMFLVKSNDVPIACDIQCTAITAGTDYELGLYDYNMDGIVGAVVSKGLLMTGQTMATASVELNGMAAVTADKRGQKFWQLLGLSADPQKTYVVALTGDTVGTAAGTINVDLSLLTAG
jgi:hypothetical protein